VLRWDARALHGALDAERARRDSAWRDLAGEIGAVSSAALTGLANGGRCSFPGVMRIVSWLDRPAASFTRHTVA
jgi:hypothetical protein